MSRQPLLRLRTVGRAAIGVLGVATALLLAPAATAQPEVEAADAITAAWQASGGDAGPLGPPVGDAYPVGGGFAQDFASGKMYFTPDTGAHYMQGAILEKFESLGGAADGDLGFPTIDEGPGLAPESRNSTFSAPDNPVIFWTPTTGARVVRGAINAAWDQLGGSTGVLGVPIEDATYDGAVFSQKFANGELTYDSSADTFTTVPPELAEQLNELSVPDDPIAAINAAQRAAGGPMGPLGAPEGEPYEIGDVGMGQDFVNGKIFYSPDTGANVVTGQVLAKYESVGGPEGDLGFPVTSEMDGGMASASRISRFAADDQPLIFWTPDYGAVIVRGPMTAAWEALGGATGDLGPPVADQTQDGDVISQRFNEGAVSFDTSTNEFSTEPASLAPQLVGLEIPGQQAPSAPVATDAPDTDEGTAFQWTWWWLLAIVPILLLVAVVAFAVTRNRRRRGGEDPFAYPADEAEEQNGYSAGPVAERPSGGYGGEDALFGDRYAREGLGSLTAAAPATTGSDEVSPLSFWSTQAAEDAGRTHERPGGVTGVGEEDPDAVDTTPTRIPTADEVESPHERDLEPSDVEPRDLEPDVEPDQEPHGESEEPDAGSAVEPVAAEPAGSAPEFERDPLTDTGRHARIEVEDPTPVGTAVHLPLADPRQVPGGYPIKADTRSGLYWAPDSPDYREATAEIYFASEEMARTMGFVRADY